MSPLEIQILLHYHYSPDDVENIDTPAVRKAAEKFVKHGILRRSDRSQEYEANREAIDVYILAITSVPLPENLWIMNSNTD